MNKVIYLFISISLISSCTEKTIFQSPFKSKGEYDRYQQCSFCLKNENQEFRSAYNQKENDHRNHIPLNFIRNANALPFEYTQRNLSEILVNQTEIRLYLTFYDKFGTKRMLVCCSKSIGAW